MNVRKYTWLCVTHGGLEPDVLSGPYRTRGQMIRALEEHVVKSEDYDSEDDDIFTLETTGPHKPEFGCFSGGFMDGLRAKRDKYQLQQEKAETASERER